LTSKGRGATYWKGKFDRNEAPSFNTIMVSV